MSGTPAVALLSVLSFAGVLLPAGAFAQVTGKAVGDGSGPVSELSTNVGAGSRPVHESGRSVGPADAGPISGHSVRGSARLDVRSGPVSEISAGPVGTQRSDHSTAVVGDASRGAVKLDRHDPIRQPIAEPVTELRDLQQSLRAIEPLAADNRVD
jgi:hypothetical protein